MIVGHIGGSFTPSYDVPKSLRFRANASAYLARTLGTPTNNLKWTWSGWVKLGSLTPNQYIFSTGTDANGTNQARIAFNTSNRLSFTQTQDASSTFEAQKDSTAVFRDISSHYHILCSFDSANATADDRVKLWVNGSRITSFSGSVNPSLNLASRLNASRVHDIGRYGAGGQYFDGQLSEVNFIDGQVLDPNSFGQIDPVTDEWAPKAYTGTYGANGFYLPFSDGTSLSTLTADASGNGNNWTATNISLTAGVNYDWMDDTPTNNHCTLNNLVAGAANITKANLASGTTAVRGTFNAMAINSYWEVTAGGSNVTAGVINDAGTTNTVTVTANKTFGFRLSTSGTLDYINITDAGSWTSITTGLSGNQFSYGTTAAADWNFGQRPFSGSVPSGYAKLCSKNIAAGAITTSGSFTGNADADGPFIFLNGTPTAMTINGNAVTWGTDADKIANGFKVRSSSASYNASGTNTYSITSTGAAFKNARAQVNP